MKAGGRPATNDQGQIMGQVRAVDMPVTDKRARDSPVTEEGADEWRDRSVTDKRPAT